MNLTAKIIIIIQTVLIIFFIVYANIQASEASKQRALSEKLAENAMIQEKRAVEIVAQAVEAQNKAEEAAKIAEKTMAELKACKNNK